MQTCPNQDELVLLLSDSLSDSRRDQFTIHIEGCSECQAALDQLTGDADTQPLRGAEDSTAERLDPTLFRLMQQLRQSPPVADWSGGGEVTDEEIVFPGPATEDAPLGQLEGYGIVEKLASGATGVLYRAVDTKLGRTVAVKVLRSAVAATGSARARLEREARAVASLSHDHIVTLYQIGSQPDFPPYLVMEYIEGESLGERVHRVGPLPPREAARIVQEVAQALGAAHQQHLVHRDVKPSNIMMDQVSGRAKVTDFGLARPDEPGSRLTMEGAIAGTPAYMSPEQILDPNQVDGRSDIYSLGVVLFELLTGTVPFRGVVRMTLMQVLHDEPPPPRQLNDNLPRDLETICLKAMAKDPDGRYQTQLELAEDLQRWMEDKPVQARPVSASGRLLRWCRRNRKIAALSTAVIVLLTAVAVVSSLAAVALAAASNQAKAAQKAAIQNAEAATEQRDLALETLRKLVYDVYDELESEKFDIGKVQKKILNIALDGLRKVAESAENKGLVDYSTAVAHHRLGFILWRLDENDQAAKEYHHALNTLDRLQTDYPNDTGLRQLRIETQWGLSDIELESQNYGSAVKYLDVALAACKKIAEAPGEDLRLQQLLITAHQRMGDARTQMGEDETAAAHFRESLQIVHRLLRQHPQNDRLLLDQLACHDRLGKLLARMSKSVPALRHLKAVIRHGNELISAREHAVELRYVVYTANIAIGDISSGRGQPVKAEKFYGQALAGIRASLDEFPGHMMAMEDLARTCSAMGAMREKVGDQTGARKYYEEMQSAINQYLHLIPEDLEAARDLTKSHMALANVSPDLNQTREHWNSAIRIMKPITEREEVSVQDRQRLVEACLASADAEWGAGQIQAARDLVVWARTLCDRIEEDDNARGGPLARWLRKQRKAIQQAAQDLSAE